MQTFKSFNRQEHDRIFDVLFEHDDGDIIDSILGLTVQLQEKSQTSPLTPQAWDSLNCSQNDDKCEAKAKEIYDKAFAMAKAAEKTFERMLKRAASGSRNAKVLVDIKQFNSFVTKVMTRGKPANQITDVLRAAILVNTDQDMEGVVKKIRKDFNVIEFEHKGKKEVQTRTYDEKGREQIEIKPGDSTYGYHGSYHFLVKVDGIISEIQVMTRKLWSYKDAAHKVYDELRAAGDEVDEITKKVKLQMSKHIFAAGNKPNPRQVARRTQSGRTKRK